jgi:hypothetical protein
MNDMGHRATRIVVWFPGDSRSRSQFDLERCVSSNVYVDAFTLGGSCVRRHDGLAAGPLERRASARACDATIGFYETNCGLIS